MLQLEIEFSDGTRNYANGCVDWIEAAIEQAAGAGKPITGWSLMDSKEA